MNSNKMADMSTKNIREHSTQLILITLAIISISINAFAGTKEWKKETTDDGKTTIQWNVSRNYNGSAVIEYIAASTANVSLQDIVKVFKDVENHKTFNKDKESKILKTLSDNEWDIYYFMGVPWPLKDTELVAKMIFAEDAEQNVATFKITADSNINLPKNKKINRFSIYDLTYLFRDGGDGNVEIVITSKTVAPFKVPVWLISLSLPDRPVGKINRLVKLASEVQRN